MQAINFQSELVAKNWNPWGGESAGKPKIEMIEDNLPPPVGNLAFSLKC
jgi:hypothetical protein